MSVQVRDLDVAGSPARIDTPDPRPAVPIERRRVLRRRDPDELPDLVGSAAASLAMTWLLYERLLPWHGRLGFVVLWYGCFLLLYTVVLSVKNQRVTVVDRLVRTALQSAEVLVLAALTSVIAFTTVRGWTAVRHLQFFSTDLSGTDPGDRLTHGGVLHGVVGTLEQVTIAVSITVPLGIACAVFLNEVRGRLSRPVRILVDAMSAVPSIVAGLFIYALAILALGWGRCGIAAALAISIMMLPIVIRTSEVVLRLVPNGLREASLALGSSQWQTVWRVVLPTARSGLATAVVLAMARGIGETAPVLLTAGYTTNLNGNPLSGAQVSLPLVIYNLVRKPQPEAISRGFGAALVLLTLVMVLFVAARIIGGRRPGELSARQLKRAARTVRLSPPVPPDPSQGSL